jgi:quercetin dioxygenase-like cupin family protein
VKPEYFVRSSDSGPRVAVVGDVYRFLATGKETAGKYALIDATVPPGGGPPMHIHSREEEGFYVLEGAITFRVKEDSGVKTVVATPGMSVHLAVGSKHAFRNESDAPARMLILLAPAGLEEMFLEVGVELTDADSTAQPPTHEEIERLLAIAPKYGVEILPPEHH